MVTGSETHLFPAATPLTCLTFLKSYCRPGNRSDTLCALESPTQLAFWGAQTKIVLDVKFYSENREHRTLWHFGYMKVTVYVLPSAVANTVMKIYKKKNSGG